MAHDDMLPPLQTFSEVSKLLSQDEATDIISSIKKKYPGKLGNLGENDFSGLLQGLFKVGAISEDLSLIPKITANAKKNDEIQALVNKCEPLEVKEFVGKEEDVERVCKNLKRVRGVNLFGESGVGKTTLAQEIAKCLKHFKPITIDLRGILEMGDVYFQVLEGFNLRAWDKDIGRFIAYLKSLKENTLLILDNIEQLHETPSEEAEKDIESPRAEFFDFLLEIVSSQACQSGYLKLLLTSREKLDDSKLRNKLLSDHNVKPFDEQVSKTFLGHVKKEIPGMSKEIEEESMSEIVNLCKNIPYLLQCAKQMLREGFKTSSEVLERLKSELRKSVPEEYACMAEQFESISGKDHTDCSDVYRMESSPRGLMVIINIQTFDLLGLPERKGSERDVDELTDLFQGKLDFKVCTIIDKPRTELLIELGRIVRNPANKDYDCLAVCIMSHGNDDIFYAYDGIQIRFAVVFNMLSNSLCEVFRNKPKLFFIQVCRSRRGGGFLGEADGLSEEGSAAQAPPVERKDLDMADMLIAYSSFEDNTSYRDMKEGSYFIQSLVSVFREYADKENILHIMIRVNNEVYKRAHVHGRTQVSVSHQSLRKKL